MHLCLFLGRRLWVGHDALSQDRHTRSGMLRRDVLRCQGDDGCATVEFPQANHGFRDFILLNHKYQVTVGNRKSYVAVKRI
jgi:hypothetical protein